MPSPMVQFCWTEFLKNLFDSCLIITNSCHHNKKNFFLIFIYLAAPGLSCSMWDLRCHVRTLSCSMWDLVRDRTQAPCIGSMES